MIRSLKIDKLMRYLPFVNVTFLMFILLWLAGVDDSRPLWMILLLWAVVAYLNFSQDLWQKCFITSAVSVGLILFNIIYPPKRYEVRIENASNTINEFHKCWTPKDYKKCPYASEELKSLSTDIVFKNNEKIFDILGDRISGEALKRNHVIEFASRSGDHRGEIIYTSIRAIYAKDKAVREGYHLILNKDLGHYQVNSFSIRSKLLKLDLNL